MCTLCGKKFKAEHFLQQHLAKWRGDDEGHAQVRLLLEEEHLNKRRETGRVCVTLVLTHALYDSFRSREPLIEARGCSAHWDKAIGRNMSTITSIVVTRAYTKCVMRFAVERISRVSKAELAEISALHREWVKGEDSYEYYYVFFLKR